MLKGKGSWVWFVAVVPGAMASGCMVDVSPPSPCEGLAGGDVLITEVMANPRGPDLGHEWLELHNPSGEAVSLQGLRIEVSRADGSGARNYTLDAVELWAGGWLVLGDSRADPLPAHLDASYGSALGALRNSDARVALHCGDVLVDEMTYERTRDGHALVLDGGLDPSKAQAGGRWCHATELEYEPGNFGTPGGPNEPCPPPAVPKTELGVDECMEGDAPRTRVSPEPGDLLITEVMANTSQVPDTTGEWFEVLVTRTVDLAGLEVGTDVAQGPRLTLDGVPCRRAEAGALLLFARSSDATVNGGLPPVDHEFRFFLVNGDGGLYLGHGERVLDAVAWDHSTAGVALQRDDAGRWCDAVEPYGDGDLGTPGEPNPPCADPSDDTDPDASVPDDAPGGDVLCEEDGTWRPLNPPGRGDLRINEVMANSAQVPDVTGEWFELKALRAVDLSGLEVGTVPAEGPRLTLDASSCARVEAGDKVLFARSDDAAVNGGLPTVDHLFRFFLVNTDGGLFVGHGGEVLDEVSWAHTTSGTAIQRGEGEAWCDASSPYGDGDLGTPRAPNLACPGA